MEERIERKALRVDQVTSWSSGESPWPSRVLDALEKFDTNVSEIEETPDSNVVMEMWKRLATHSLDEIRYPALGQVLRPADGTYLFEHRKKETSSPQKSLEH